MLSVCATARTRREVDQVPGYLAPARRGIGPALSPDAVHPPRGAAEIGASQPSFLANCPVLRERANMRMNATSPSPK
jgi:hypothetical protein